MLLCSRIWFKTQCYPNIKNGSDHRLHTFETTLFRFQTNPNFGTGKSDRVGSVDREQIPRFVPDSLHWVLESISLKLECWLVRFAASEVLPDRINERKTPMSSKIEARVSHRFEATAERVFDAWLDTEKVRLWLAAALKSFGLAGDIRRIEIDPQVGGKFFFSDMRDGKEAQHWGNYLELDRPLKIVFTWIVDPSEEANPSKVTLTIQPESNGCVATIVHEMNAKWADYVAQTEGGWARMLKQVDNILR